MEEEDKKILKKYIEEYKEIKELYKDDGIEVEAGVEMSVEDFEHIVNTIEELEKENAMLKNTQNNCPYINTSGVKCKVKELEKENKELKHLEIGIEKVRDLKIPAKTDFIIVMRENYLPYLKADYIPKSKIEDKIKEIEKYKDFDEDVYAEEYAVDILKELLEEK